MPPTQNTAVLVENYIKENVVMVFSKTTCPFCAKVKALFSSLQVPFQVFEVDQVANTAEIQEELFKISGLKTVPNVYVNGQHIGGCDATLKAHNEGRLLPMIQSQPTQTYDYDLVVIGGGSGGLAASKQAAGYGKKVAVLDFVKPTPKGTSWGLGGTCVNVGCIPKKLMHQASLLGKAVKEAKAFGWGVDAETVKLSWEKMVEAVQNYIGSLNWGYRVQLRSKNVTYINSYGTFLDDHTIKAVNRRGKEQQITSDKFIIAVGERPRYPDIPGAKEFCITSDDLFSLSYCPGKTLVIGASYVALECAGFLGGIGLDVTVMVRSIFLRGFDQQIAEKIGAHMEQDGIKFLRRYVPVKIEQLTEGEPGSLKVTGKSTETGSEITEEYNTVILAIGRDSVTKTIGLENAGVAAAKNGKIPVNEFDQTNVLNIFCIGDNAEDKPELTPVAIQAGRLLSNRLFGGSTTKCDYNGVPTTVFTPLEYSCCGLSEESAQEKFGENNLEVYHSAMWPLEWTVPAYDSNTCYIKAITNKLDNEKVVGLHYLGPNAGEVMQGFAAAMKCGLTKSQLDATIGIHPTNAEMFTTLNVTKSSGGSIEQSGC
uniref:Thioredoxin reductase 1, cytoplasmic n=1 Tax=Phallusia mammillata TaxID=59560 RepID=A0A6F9DWK5_9ASCI|nr:thioredoxin reductase 3 [Phallusia mammillata]